MISWYSTDFFVSCSGSHLHQSKSINIFYTGKPEPFPGDICGRAKKKKRKSREVRIEWEKRERSGSNGKKNGGLGRVEKGGRLKETLIRLNKERGLDRVKKKTGKFGSGRKEGGKPGPGGKMEGSLRGLGCFFTQPDPKLPAPFCSAAVISFCFTN